MKLFHAEIAMGMNNAVMKKKTLFLMYMPIGYRMIDGIITIKDDKAELDPYPVLMAMEQDHSCEFKIAKMCRVLKVSKSSYYAWINRPNSKRAEENKALLDDIRDVYSASNNIYGSIKVKKAIEAKKPAERKCKLKRINHKRIERIMHEEGIVSKVRKKYKATTNSNHNLPVAENILNREFEAEMPNEKLVSDITYVPTEEGWLYVAGILDLCGGKIVGLSMSKRMTKELVINALHDAYLTSGRSRNGILHSDRGSQVRQEVA